MEAACSSSMASSKALTSASPCRSRPQPSDRRLRATPPSPGNARMPHDSCASRASALARWSRVGTVLVTTALLASCAGELLTRNTPRSNDQVQVVDRSAASTTAITSYLDSLQRLLVAPPAEQAEVVAAAQREFEQAPTPSHQL